MCDMPLSRIFFSETSNLVLTEDIAYEQLLNRVPDNTAANNDGLVLLSDEGGLLGLLSSFFFWEKKLILKMKFIFMMIIPFMEKLCL